MEDNRIIELYLSRSEDAIKQTESKYGKYCHTIANNILQSLEDSEECVSDTYMKAWNSIPPDRPSAFKAYLGKITRNLALDKFRHYNAEKRGAGQTVEALEELGECVSAKTGDMIDEIALVELLNNFLASLSTTKRKVFMGRYWYFSSVKEIASDYRMTESKVIMMLHRTRQELKAFLEKEGISI